jgi:elongation factor 1-gamma
MALKLYTFAGDFRGLKALIAGQYNGVEIERPAFEMGKDNKTAEFLAMSPMGKVPVLETPKGAIFESNAIARYVARIRADTELTGASFFQKAQVDSWVDFCSLELELPSTLLIYPILGYMEHNAAMYNKAKGDLHKALAVLDAHLTDNTFLVGNSVTLADIVCVTALFYPFKMVLDTEVQAKFSAVTRWFVTCVNQPQFASVLGDVPLCRTAMAPAGAAAGGKGKKGGKKEAKKADKKAKKEKKKAAAPAPAPAPAKAAKPTDVLDKLPKSSMVLDAWKRDYSNSRSDYFASMPGFWEKLDREGWSVWFCDYNYNSENVVDFQTSNLVGGFLQRTDQLRKYAFGVMQILNTKAPFEITGAWLLRGQDIAPMLEVNPDAEYYTWTKMNPDDEAQRKKVGEIWCGESVEGKEAYDSKVFK